MATSDFHNSSFLELDVKWTCVVPLKEETKQSQHSTFLKELVTQHVQVIKVNT